MTNKMTKKEFFQLENGLIQDITREFIRPHILRNQSYLVNDLMNASIEGSSIEGFSIDDIENQYLTDDEILLNHLDEIELVGWAGDKKEITPDMLDEYKYDNPKEIFEWYLVSDWFLDRLRDINEPIINNDYGEYWGRCCTGQSIYLDYDIQELAYEWSSDERLNKNEEVA